jgi:hypothetical protein
MLCDLWFSRRSFWRFLSSGISCRVVRWKSTDISEEHVTSIFRVEENATSSYVWHLLSRWFIPWPILSPCRRRRCVPPKRRFTFNRDTELYRRRQKSPLLISASTHSTRGSSSLNMTNRVTVAAESELQIHTQRAGSRGKLSRFSSGGSRFESRPKHSLP